MARRGARATVPVKTSKLPQALIYGFRLSALHIGHKYFLLRRAHGDEYYIRFFFGYIVYEILSLGIVADVSRHGVLRCVCRDSVGAGLLWSWRVKENFFISMRKSS